MQKQSIGELIKPSYVNGCWRKPVISARKASELKYYFERAGVPWIYTQERPEVHTESAYNRRPKGTKFSNNYESKLSMIRKNLSQQEERLEKLRLDRDKAKKPTMDEAQFHLVLKTI